MNVITIISDTFRRDNLTCYGGTQVHTPCLDEFSKKAIVFDRCYCASFPTVPNRNDILTSRYTFTYKPWSPLNSDEITLQETLKKASILTKAIMDTPHPFGPGYNYQRGFQGWEIIRGQEGGAWKTFPNKIKIPCRPKKLRGSNKIVTQYLRNVSDRKNETDYFPARTMTAAMDWLEKCWLEKKKDQSFFLYIDTFDPHEPWDPPKYYTDLYDPGYEGEEVIYPRYDEWERFLTREELSHCKALYAGEVTMVDAWIGKLIGKIKRLGFMKDTIIIFTSDHGFYFGEHGYIGKSLIRDYYQQSLPLYPEVSLIPFIIYIPGIDKQMRISSLVQPVDLMPTVLDFMGVKIPSTTQGCSLKPLVEGKVEKVRDLAISSPTLSYPKLEVPHPSNRASIVDRDWMLIYGSQADETKNPETTHMVDGLGRQFKVLEEKPMTSELYYLPDDLNCNKNVFEEHYSEAKRLHSEFVKFLEQQSVPEKHLKFFRDI